jgi:endonuclease/exonuclease/phosphatase family metal-dependent hydrolase
MSQARVISVASLNLHGGVDRHGRPYDVAAACHLLKADVIALQEVWRADGEPDEFAAVASALGGQVRHGLMASGISLARLRVGPEDGRTGDWGVAVLTSLPVLRYEEINLGRAPLDGLPRLAQALTLAVPGGGTLRIVNTHLTHRMTSPAQLILLTSRLNRDGAAAGPCTSPTLIAGDLNMPGAATWTAGHVYRRVVRGLTFPAHRPLVQIDHLLASRGIRAEAAEVLPGVGSDHLPVRAQLLLG